jgi:hypothetical protein
MIAVSCQIVLLFTKAVSDFFGGGGMSDQMIKFNGFPFLEKEDKEAADPAYLEPSKPRSAEVYFTSDFNDWSMSSCQRDETGYSSDSSQWHEIAGNR